MEQGPQVDDIQLNRDMGYIQQCKDDVVASSRLRFLRVRWGCGSSGCCLINTEVPFIGCIDNLLYSRGIHAGHCQLD